MRGHLHSHNNTGTKGRSYTLLVLLIFGSAIFGVMTLRKLRDRRICAVLVKEKDEELNGLQLLLQKAKKQADDMKTNINWLHTQKKDLDSKILEMKSTISSLKEEERAMQLALGEKQHEIEMLRGKQMETMSDTSQITLLSETLRQKQAEIEDLKRHLEILPVKVWSVSADDPSNPPINVTIEAAGSMDGGRSGSAGLQDSIRPEDQRNLPEAIDSSANESVDQRNKDVSGQGDEDMRNDGERFHDENGKTGEDRSQQLKTSQEDVPGNSTNLQINEGQRKNTANHKNRKESYLDKQRYTDDNAPEEIEDDRNQVRKKGNEVEENDKGVVMKSEMQENAKGTGRSRVTKNYIRKTRAQEDQE